MQLGGRWLRLDSEARPKSLFTGSIIRAFDAAELVVPQGRRLAGVSLAPSISKIAWRGTGSAAPADSGIIDIAE